MSAEQCLKKAYVKFRYIPPPHPRQPVDCKQVKFTKPPEIRIFTGQISKLEGQREDELIGIDLHCAVPSTSGAGGIILLLQVSSYIEWEIEFLAAAQPQFNVPLELQPQFCPKAELVRETHRVYVSLPVMYKLAGPRIALMAITPWKLKLPVYAAQIWNAFKKLNELEKPMAAILALKKGFCPEDIKTLEEALKKAEKELNDLLQQAQQGSSAGDIATRMQHKMEGSGRFAGTRLA